MKRDPREREMARAQNWRDGRWVEFVLTNDHADIVLTVLIDGEVYRTVQMAQAEDESTALFNNLVKRFLKVGVAA